MIYSTGTININAYRNPAFPDPPAVTDFTGSGAFTPNVDTTVMLRDQSGSAGMVTYAELRAAVEEAGGTATGPQVAEKLSEGAEESYMRFGSLPPGLTHPIVDYVFRLDGDQLKADYKAVKTARVIPPEDGNIATVDYAGHGVSRPEEGAMLSVEAFTSEGTFTGMLGLDSLKQAVRANGGQVTHEQESDAFRSLAPPHLGELRSVRLVEWPQHVSQFDNVQRTFRLEGDQLLVDFHQPTRD